MLHFSANSPSSCPAILFTKTVAIIIFVMYPCLGLVDKRQRRLEDNMTIG